MGFRGGFCSHCKATEGINKAGFCKPCGTARTRAWHQANPGRSRELDRRSKYGIEPEEYQRLLEAQGNACAICLQPFGELVPCVDHIHGTKVVRGLLCKWCNLALGHLKDDMESVLRAADYLAGANSEVRV